MKITQGSWDRGGFIAWDDERKRFIIRYPETNEDRVRKFLKKHDSLNNSSNSKPVSS